MTEEKKETENTESAEEQKQEETSEQEEQQQETTEEKPEEKEEEKSEESKEEESKEEEQDEKKEEESEEEESEETDAEYNEYDHPALKQAVNILKTADVPVEEANAIFAEAVESGDLSKIDKKSLVEKVGQDNADIVLALAENYYNKTFSEMQKVKEEAFKLVGGEENFNTIRDWAKDKAESDPDFAKDFNEIRDMLNSEQSRTVTAGLRELFDLYKADPDTTLPANIQEGDSATGSSVEPMTRREYIDAIEKAHREGKYEQMQPRLWARRKAGLKQNI